MKLKLAISPCPNDTFAFDAMLHKKIDVEGLEFEVDLHDIETLNNRGFQNKYDITKISFPAFYKLLDNYVLLNSGSALGFGCGPILIGKTIFKKFEIDNLKIAIPGKNTTANLLLSIAYPNAKNKTEIIFSEIESKILDTTFDAGLIIHENRFTFEKKGLKKRV